MKKDMRHLREGNRCKLGSLVSIVSPVFNEQEALPAFYESLVKSIASMEDE